LNTSVYFSLLPFLRLPSLSSTLCTFPHHLISSLPSFSSFFPLLSLPFSSYGVSPSARMCF
jgi:hypothetical protein